MDYEEMKNYGAWVKAERDKHGITQRELADRCGVSHGTIAQIETVKAKAIGERVKRKIEEYFKGSPKVATDTLISINSNGTEHLKPIIARIARIIIKDEFYENVKQVSNAFACDKEAAAIAIIENLLKK